MRNRALLLLLASFSAAFGQITGNSPSVTVTSTLGQSLPPDQVSFLVTIETPLATNFDDLMSALQGTGLSTASFSNVSSSQQYSGNSSPTSLVLLWSFQIPVPIANLKSESATLLALATTLAQAQNPLALSYTVSGPQISAQAKTQSCGQGDLVTAVRTKAQQIASAADQKPGSISSLSSSVSTQIGPSATAPYVIPSCSLTATFGSSQQTASTITVSASRTVNVPPDLVLFTASVVTPAGATLDDALAALPGTGFAAGNLVNVSGFSSLQWMFSMTVPFSKMKDTAAALQKAAAQGSAVTISVQGAQISPQLLAAQDCSYASLLNDAQAQARQVTAAAGVSLNGLISINDGTVSVPAGSVVYGAVLTQFVSVGSFSSLISPYYQAAATPSCTLVAQFGIGQ